MAGDENQWSFWKQSMLLLAASAIIALFVHPWLGFDPRNVPCACSCRPGSRPCPNSCRVIIVAFVARNLSTNVTLLEILPGRFWPLQPACSRTGWRPRSCSCCSSASVAGGPRCCCCWDPPFSIHFGNCSCTFYSFFLRQLYWLKVNSIFPKTFEFLWQRIPLSCKVSVL